MTKSRLIIGSILAICVAGWLALDNISTAGNNPLRLKWSIETGGPINLPPVVIGERVLVIPEKGPLMALSAANGDQHWTYAPPEGVWSRSLGAEGDRVYVCLRDSGLAALNAADGGLLWKINLGINCQRSPFISGDTLYVSTTFVGEGLPGDTLTGAKLFSINAADGNINWSFTTDNYLLQTAYRQADTVYVGGSFRNTGVDIDEGGMVRFYALDSKTGQSKWNHQSQDGFPKALYATAQRLVYIGYQDFLVALDTASGDETWRRDTGNWVPSLKGQGEVVYYGSANTAVHAWNMQDGKIIWKYNIPGGSFNYMLGHPEFVEDRLYFMSQKGTVFALSRETGTELWSQPTKMNSRIGLRAVGSSLFMGDSKGRVYAYSILK